MQIRLKLDPIFRSKADGQSAVLLEVPEGASVADALESLTEKWPEIAPLLETNTFYTVFVNSRIVPRGRAGDVRLRSGDTLYVFEPVAGG